MSKIDFRKAIKKRMNTKKINTPELARKAELNVQTLYNFLAGKSEMATYYLMMTSQELNKIERMVHYESYTQKNTN